MATYIQNLQARKVAIAAELAAMSATTAGGIPTSGKSGVDHVGYKDGLYRELAQLDEFIDKAGLSATDGNATVFEVLSIGET